MQPRSLALQILAQDLGLRSLELQPAPVNRRITKKEYKVWVCVQSVGVDVFVGVSGGVKRARACYCSIEESALL